MLFRGQNILGYNHYADDVVEYFVQKSVANGMDIIRIFDCFNDLRNLKTAVYKVQDFLNMFYAIILSCAVKKVQACLFLKKQEYVFNLD